MTADEGTVTSLYCERAGLIVPLDGDFCRACSKQAREGDGVHRRVTPDLLKQEGYVSTPVPRSGKRRDGE